MLKHLMEEMREQAGLEENIRFGVSPRLIAKTLADVDVSSGEVRKLLTGAKSDLLDNSDFAKVFPSEVINDAVFCARMLLDAAVVMMEAANKDYDGWVKSGDSHPPFNRKSSDVATKVIAIRKAVRVLGALL